MGSASPKRVDHSLRPRAPTAWVLWALASALWALALVLWALASALWALALVPWALASVLWALESVLWVRPADARPQLGPGPVRAAASQRLRYLQPAPRTAGRSLPRRAPPWRP